MPLRFALRVIAVVSALGFATAPLRAQSASADLKLGKQTFSNCAPCHGLDGAGGEHAPGIVTDPAVQRMSDAALSRIIRNGIPVRGMPAFGQLLSNPQIQAVVAYVRALQNGQQTTVLKGNPVSGHELFFGRGGCAQCHMVHGSGGFLAADLSTYAKGRGEAKIREAIVAPNRDFDPRRGTATVTTADGKTYRGIIRDEDNFSLQMQTPDGVFHFFDKRDLATIAHEPVSLMPADYGTKLSDAQIDDVVSFLAEAAKSTTNTKANQEDE